MKTVILGGISRVVLNTETGTLSPHSGPKHSRTMQNALKHTKPQSLLLRPDAFSFYSASRLLHKYLCFGRHRLKIDMCTNDYIFQTIVWKQSASSESDILVHCTDRSSADWNTFGL
eukprot:scaffold39678_cov18-Prasinocladus_malaysianus.AAC.1